MILFDRVIGLWKLQPVTKSRRDKSSLSENEVHAFSRKWGLGSCLPFRLPFIGGMGFAAVHVPHLFTPEDPDHAVAVSCSCPSQKTMH